MHELEALAFEILRFESYLTTRNQEEVLAIILQGKENLDLAKYQYLHPTTKEFDEFIKYYLLHVSAKIKGEKEKQKNSG